MAHHGVASLDEVRSLGLTRHQLAHRVRIGRLHRIHPGVYAIGHPSLTRHGRWRAAVLACGANAVLSHRDAAALWGFRQSARRKIDVTTPDRGRKGGAHIDLHRARTLDPRDLSTHEGIPTTTVARTLVDLAEVIDHRSLARAVHEAEVQRLLDAAEVTAVVERSNGRRAAKRLADLLADPVPPTRSELEWAFLHLVRDAGLPEPLVDVWIETPSGRRQVDFFWPQERLAVELDGVATHHTRRGFENDRRRDVELALAGILTVRYTWRRITTTADVVERELRQLLLQRKVVRPVALARIADAGHEPPSPSWP